MATANNPVVWFEIPVSDMPRAKAFYEQVFAVHLEEQPMGSTQMAFFSMSNETYGATGALTLGKDYTPSHSGVLIYFTTPDIDATLASGEATGGKILTAKTGIGEYGFIGVMQDSEGNRIGLHSMT